jgi:hypothetical protein
MHGFFTSITTTIAVIILDIGNSTPDTPFILFPVLPDTGNIISVAITYMNNFYDLYNDFFYVIQDINKLDSLFDSARIDIDHLYRLVH